MSLYISKTHLQSTVAFQKCVHCHSDYISVKKNTGKKKVLWNVMQRIYECF